MIIHIVQPGETIQSIADNYGVNKERLIFDNDIMNSNNLVVGQTIVIVYPGEVYIVNEGDTILSIAAKYNITALQLVRNNSFLLNREVIPGEEVIISYRDEKIMNISTNGYAYPYIDQEILRKNLLYLTYLSIFSYNINDQGELNDIEDIPIINMAKSFGVAPIMVISGESAGGSTNRVFLHSLINNSDLIYDIIENVSNRAKEKGYYAVDLDTPFISAGDRQAFFEFVEIFAERLHQEDIQLFITITPNSFETQGNERIDAVNYAALGNIADKVILLSYSWGYTSEIPIEAAPISILEILLQYIVSQIPSEKLIVGLSSIGYIVEFPPIKGVAKASSISNSNAILLASDSGAQIEFNQSNQSSYFYVTGSTNYFVYFHDIRGVDTALSALIKYDVHGVGIWNVMYYLAQTFLLINTQYNIENP